MESGGGQHSSLSQEAKNVFVNHINTNSFQCSIRNDFLRNNMEYTWTFPRAKTPSESETKGRLHIEYLLSVMLSLGL